MRHDRARRPSSSASALRLPDNPQFFGQAMPSVVKATAIVNGEVITQTDIDQRLALLAIANEGGIPADEIDAAAPAGASQPDRRDASDPGRQDGRDHGHATRTSIARSQRVADGHEDDCRPADRLSRKANGSSMRSLRRQIEGETAWRRLQQAKIENSRQRRRRRGEGRPRPHERVEGHARNIASARSSCPRPATTFRRRLPNANQIIEQLRQGASFAGYARQYSEASTAAVGGDLGWVRPEQLPEPLAAAVRRAWARARSAARSPFQAAFRSSRSRTPARS